MISFSQRHAGAGSRGAGGKALFLMALTMLMVSSLAFANTAKKLLETTRQISALEQSLDENSKKIKKLERELWNIDYQIQQTRKLIRQERSDRLMELHSASRELKRQTFEIERLEKAIALLDQEIELARRDNQRSQEYFNSLNALKRQLTSASHERKLQANLAKIAKAEKDKKPLQAKIDIETGKLDLLKERIKTLQAEVNETSFEEDERIIELTDRRKKDAVIITKLRNQVRKDLALLENLRTQKNNIQLALAKSKPKKTVNKQAVTTTKPSAPTPVTPEDGPPYVFVISGEYVADIEKTLNLKKWVESYGAKYIQARWNGIDFSDVKNEPNDTELFKKQFREKLQEIPKNSKIILIGHGRGGGAAIEAATKIAYDLNRTIDFLAVLDPIGDENLRANIVYETESECGIPSSKKESENLAYLRCIKRAEPRLITANVKHFYNRWQKDGKGPLDYQRRLKAVDNNGKTIEAPTATGRFKTAKAIITDQKRLFFNGAQNAHKALLEEEAKQLPRLLVKHLR